MELDDFKQQLIARLAAAPEKTPVALEQMLHAKTQSVVAKLKRSLWFECISGCGLVIGFIIIAATTPNGSLAWYFGVFSLICTAFIVALVLLIRKANSLTLGQGSIKDNLITLCRVLEEFIKRYFQFTFIILPLSVVFALNLRWQQQADTAFMQEPSATSTGLGIALMILYLLLTITGLYFFTRWYLKKLYGNYLAQLKAHLQDLDN